MSGTMGLDGCPACWRLWYVRLPEEQFSERGRICNYDIEPFNFFPHNQTICFQTCYPALRRRASVFAETRLTHQGFEAAVTISTASASVSVPARMAGSGTGAKKGEWFTGSGLPCAL